MPSRPKSFSLSALAAVFACLGLAFFGAAPAASAPKSAGGGLVIPETPAISDVVCLTGCVKIREATVGGTIQITGSNMDSVKQVVFRSSPKNLRVEPLQVTGTRVEAAVPEGAISGRVRVISATNSASNPSAQILTIGSQKLLRAGKLTVTDATTSPTKAFQYGKRNPTLRFVVNGSSPTLDLRVDVVNAAGDVIRSRFLNGVPSGSTQKVAWGGVMNGGRNAPNGAYRFVIRGNDGATATVANRLKRKLRQASAPTNTFNFRMYGYIFPLRGPHTYGQGIGAGRGHQGIDILSRCGQPLVAARAGVVYYNSYQASGAGNYLVINTKGTGGKSHVYMHMPTRSPLKVGTHVKTGQRIGRVGTTGRSTACHLHFEIWSGPGWYQGGSFLDPTRWVKAWDRYS